MIQVKTKNQYKNSLEKSQYTAYLTRSILGVFLLFLPVIVNRWALIHVDTHGYLITAQLLFHPGAFRPYFYSAFVRLLGMLGSLTLVSFVQALIIQYMIDTLCVVLFPKDSFLSLKVIFVLCLTTALPWVTNEIMADIFTPLSAVCLFLLVYCEKRLSRLQLTLISLLFMFSVGTHFTCVVLVLGTLGIIAFSRILSKNKKLLLLQRGLLLAFLFGALGIASIPIWRAAVGESPLPDRGWIMGRLIHDKIITQLLSDRCDRVHYILCDHLELIKSSNRPDWYLWDQRSPRAHLGTKQQINDGEWEMIKDSIISYPMLHIFTALKGSIVQFFSVDAGLEFSSSPHGLEETLTRLYPEELSSYIRASQKTGELVKFVQDKSPLYNFGYLIFLGIVGVFALLKKWIQKSIPELVWKFSNLSLGYLVLNAIVCGSLSGPFDRYQVRVVWLIALASIFLIIAGYTTLEEKGSDWLSAVKNPANSYPKMS